MFDELFKSRWMPLLLFYHEFLSVLDIDTLGESFCRICMFANQFALDAVDVIATGLICLDMANASIDGIFEINHDGYNALGWDGNQLIQTETALDVLQVFFRRCAVTLISLAAFCPSMLMRTLFCDAIMFTYTKTIRLPSGER